MQVEVAACGICAWERQTFKDGIRCALCRSAWARGRGLCRQVGAGCRGFCSRAAGRLLEKGTIDLRRLVTHVVSLSEYPQFMQGVVAGQVDGYIKGVVKL